MKALAAIDDEYNWAFVNKEDSQIYWNKIFTSWFAQAVIIGVLILGVLVMVRRKDVV